MAAALQTKKFLNFLMERISVPNVFPQILKQQALGVLK